MNWSTADATHHLVLLIAARQNEGVSESDIRREAQGIVEDAFVTAEELSLEEEAV